MKRTSATTIYISKAILMLLSFSFFLVSACVPVGSGGGSSTVAAKKIVYDDFIYDPQIKTVQLYLNQNKREDQINYPIIALDDTISKISLEFDELGATYKNYYYKIIACNADWSPSILNDLEYLYTFNEFNIDRYEMGLGTRVGYIHYWATLPTVKLSGNYIIKVYRERNVEDIVLTRRFMVVERLVTVAWDVKFPVDVSLRFNSQQPDFVLNYRGLGGKIFNPADMLKVTLRQNGQWNKTIENLRPMFVRDEDKILDFHLLNNENVFAGLNEFRIFDIRSMRFLGQGMEDFSFNNNEAKVRLIRDFTRNKKNYNQWIDINGRFAIENFETREGATQADYINTTFTLDAPSPLSGDVYVYGQLSDWQLKPEFKMNFDTLRKAYTVTPLLKQGFYNYQYVLDNPKAKGGADYIFFEGSYNQTENIYDIFVYFRAIGGRYDRLVGYSSTNYFGR